MWSSILLEIIFRVIPECLLFVFSGYAFSKYRFQTKRYFLSVLLLFIIGYSVTRLLPVEFGISQILVIIACAALLITVNKIPTQRAIASSLAVMILGFITDIIAVVITALVKGLDIRSILSNSELFNSVFSNNFEKLAYGSISLAIMAIVLILMYVIAKSKGSLRDVPAGKSVE